jgi:predicted nucleic acid-binding protein
MRLLIDTNIVLDVLLKREPYFGTGRSVLGLTEDRSIREYVSASAITDIYYIAHRQIRDRDAVKELLKKLLLIVSVAGVGEREIRAALELDWRDFEDSVQYCTASLNDLDGVVTRNPADYRDARLRIWKPEELLAEIAGRR